MTLAQSYLELAPPHDDGGSAMGQMVVWTHRFIRTRLMAPRPTAKAAEHTAERFVFETNPVHLVSDLIKAGSITRKTMFETVKLPHINFWIEYPILFETGRGGKLGVMVGKVHTGDTAIENYKTMMAVVLHPDGADAPHAVPFALIQLPEFPMAPQAGFHPLYYATRHTNELEKDDMDACEQFVQELIDCLFLLTVPRVVEYRDAQFGPRKLKVQQRTGKPLVEFKRVNILIGAPEVRSKAGEVHPAGEAGGEGRYRYHRVGPFFRTYRARREQPKVVLMDPFWRGNPKLGIIIKEKHYDRPASPGAGSVIGGPTQQS